MSSIDERVVDMQFNHAQFDKGAASAIASLDSLKKGLNFDAQAKDLQNLENITKGFTLATMAEALDNVSDKFSVMGAVGFSVLQNLTNAALGFGGDILSKAMEPIISGGKKRALNIEQAEFQLGGLGADIEKTMAAALKAVEGTAFGLDEAAKAASQLTASNVPMERMESSLRAISGVAAMTNSSYDDMAQVFTTVAGNGRLMSNELNRVSARGLNAAAAIAESLGITEAEVRKMTTEGKISFEMFATAMDDAFGEHATKANETYTGSLANVRAALGRIGATYYAVKFEALRKVFNSLGPAVDSVHNFLKPLIAVVNNNMLSGADVAVKKLDAFKASLDSLTNDTKTLDYLSEAFKNVIGLVKDLGGLVGKAFGEIFPPMAHKQIESIAKAILDFTKGLKMSEEVANNLHRTLRGFFAIFGIGFEVLKAAAKMLADVFGFAFKGSGAILDFTGNMGDFLVSLHEAIKNGTGLTTFFEGIGKVIKVPVTIIKNLIKFLGQLSESVKIDTSGIENFADKVRARLQPLTALGDLVSKAWEGMVKGWAKVVEIFGPFASWISEQFGKVSETVNKAMGEMSFDKVLDLLNTGVLVTIGLMIKRFFSSFEGGFGVVETIKGVFDGLTGSLEAMQSSLKAKTLLTIAGAIALLTISIIALSLIDSVKLGTALGAITVMFVQLMGAMAVFEKIASGPGIVKLPLLAASLILVSIAITILAGAVSKMAKLDWGELARGLVGVVVLLGALAGAMQIMPKGTKMMGAGVGLVFLATALNIMASALSKMAQLSWEELARGLSGVVGALGGIAGAMHLMPKGMMAQSVALVILSSALLILGSAVKGFADLDWADMARGLLGVVGALAAVALGMELMPKGMMAQAIALTIVGAALKILASAISDMASMSWEEIGKGLATLAGAMLIIALAMKMMPPTMIASAVSLVLVASAITILSKALDSMGSMSWEEIGKSLVMLAGSLLIIAGAMYIMVGALPGAAALLVVSAALSMLTPVLTTLGGMSWEEIGRGLTMLAGTFLVLGLAGLVLTPLVPTLLGLGAAIALIGLGVALAGVGLLALSVGLTAVSIAGAGATTALVAMVTALIGLIPMILQQLGAGIVAMLQVFIDAAPVIGEAIVVLLTTLLDAIITVAPKLVEALVVIITSLLEAIITLGPLIIETLIVLIMALVEAVVTLIPFFVDAGMRLIIGILDGIAANIGQLITSGADVIVNFLDGIANELPRVIDSGINLIVSFVQGLADGIRNNQEAMRTAGLDLATAIIDGMTGGLFSGIGNVISAAKDVASSALAAAKDVLGINSPSKEFETVGKDSDRGMAGGFTKYAGLVTKAASAVGTGALSSMKKSLRNIGEAVSGDMDMTPVIRPVLDLTNVRRNAGELGGILTPKPLNVQMSHRNAASLAEERRMAELAIGSEAPVTNVHNEVTLNQTNTSPKALSTSEIYRNTKTQLSQVKEVVNA